MNMSSQDPGVTISIGMDDRTEAMLKKFNFWNQYVQMIENDSFGLKTSFNFLLDIW